MIELPLGGTPKEMIVHLSKMIPELLSRISLLEEQSLAHAEIIRMLRGELAAQNLLDTDKWNDLVRSVSEGISKQIRGADDLEASRIRKVSNLIREFASDSSETEVPIANLAAFECSGQNS